MTYKLSEMLVFINCKGHLWSQRSERQFIWTLYKTYYQSINQSINQSWIYI